MNKDNVKKDKSKKSSKNWKLYATALGIFTLFCLLNTAGIIIIKGQPVWDFEYEENYNALDGRYNEYNLKISYYIYGKNNNPLAILHSIISFAKPQSNQNLSVYYSFKAECVDYNFLVGTPNIKSIKIDFLQINSYNYAENTSTHSNLIILMNPKEISTDYRMEFERRFLIPAEWDISELRRFNFLFGNFSIVTIKNNFTASIDSDDNLVNFEIDNNILDEGSYFDTEYYRIDTNISPTFGFALGSKIDLTIMFLFLCLLICFYFTYQYDKYRNNNVLKNMKPKIVEKDRDFLEHFTHISKWSAYFLLTGTLLFSFIVLSYFIGYIWFGLLSLKPYLIVGINLIIIPYIAVIYLINKKTRNKRDHFQERTSTINLMKQVSKIEISFKISLNEILGIIAVILALFLFVYGNWEFPLLIPP